MATKKNGVFVLFVLAIVMIGLVKFLGEPKFEAVVCADDVLPGGETVVMLGASWCPYCNRARGFFTEQQIDYCEFDIEQSASGAKLYRQAGIKGIPIIYIRDEVIYGFNPDQLMQTLIAENLATLDDY